MKINSDQSLRSPLLPPSFSLLLSLYLSHTLTHFLIRPFLLHAPSFCLFSAIPRFLPIIYLQLIRLFSFILSYILPLFISPSPFSCILFSLLYASHSLSFSLSFLLSFSYSFSLTLLVLCCFLSDHPPVSLTCFLSVSPYYSFPLSAFLLYHFSLPPSLPFISPSYPPLFLSLMASLVVFRGY